MGEMPEPLRELLGDFALLERTDRMQLLIAAADRFAEVPASVADRPFPEEHRVQRCESQAYAWAEPADGALKFYFAVENPQGISAKALAVILDETLSGQPLEQVLEISSEIVLDIFGREISMGKGQGLMGMVSMVRALALAARSGEPGAYGVGSAARPRNTDRAGQRQQGQ